MKTILEYWKWLYNNNPNKYPKIVNNPTYRSWNNDSIEVIVNKKKRFN